MLKSRGFTLIETLINLSLIMVIFVVLPTVFSSFSTVPKHDLSTEKFLIMLNEELNQAYSVTTHDNKLYLNTHSNRTIVFEQYNDTIRKRVNQQGHEVYTRKVKNLEVNQTDKLIHLTLITLEDVRCEKKYVL